MAELDSQPSNANDEPETVVIVEETPLVIPPNRPRKVYGGMWGPLEIASVSIAAMAMLAAVLLYFFFVIPSNRELARNKSEADRLDAELISAKAKYGEITSTEVQVAKLVSSVDDFETRFLPVQTYGQSALYQRLNGLIRAYGLVNTTGPDYAPLESASLNQEQETEEEKGRSKFRSLYPGVYVTTTVEGTYQNLRRFIREIETGREFVVISAIELAPSDTPATKETENSNAAPGQIGAAPVGANPSGKGFVQPANPYLQTGQPQFNQPKGKTHGETVALHIEMAAYFRRPNFVPMPAAPAEQ